MEIFVTGGFFVDFMTKQRGFVLVKGFFFFVEIFMVESVEM